MELRDHNPFASGNIVSPAATLLPQGQAWCDPGWDIPQATGKLLNDPRMVAKRLLEGQLSSSIDPEEAAS